MYLYIRKINRYVLRRSITKDDIIISENNEQQAHQFEEMSMRIKELTAQIAWFQRQMFGRKSEKHMVLDTQLSLFDNMEESAPADEKHQEEAS